MKNSLLIKITFTFSLLNLLIHGCVLKQSESDYKTELIYSCEFESESDLEDWIMEGPGVAKIVDGKLLLHSKYYDVANKHLVDKGLIFDGFDTSFYNAVEHEMLPTLGGDTANYYHNGEFRGGDIVFWNKFKTTENYIIEFDFQSLSKHALHMIMFSVSGLDGEDVFADNLADRYGLAAHYTQSDLRSYRISFFAPGRGTTNMRKTPGKIQTVKGPDITLDNPKGVHHMKIVKYSNHIQWYINDQLSFSFADDLNDGALGAGQTAIRVMIPAMGYYDNYKIYSIIE